MMIPRTKQARRNKKMVQYNTENVSSSAVLDLLVWAALDDEAGDRDSGPPELLSIALLAPTYLQSYQSF